MSSDSPVQAALPRHLAAYYSALQSFDRHGAASEGAVRIAFQNLLSDAGRPHGFTVLAEQTLSLAGKRTIRVDGEVRDPFRIRHGIWEAKDSGDDLETEIRRKIERGYPTKNTIFENTRRAVLFQNGARVLEVDLTEPHELQRLLDRFFGYTEPQIHEFHEAVKEFRAQIPELAAGLGAIIELEKQQNKSFRQALADFHELCRASLNPQTTLEEVEDMLRQHLLTERIFRSVFSNDEFVLRNPIAQELEKVVKALTGRAFSRKEFLGKLDYFYRAIEAAARTIDSYHEKQGFLHAVYEQFFQGYSTATADTHGIVYTPRPIVRWMVASVDEALRREFGLSLGDKGVHILDPCVGTGTFVLELMEHIGPSALPHKYAHELHCNEVLLLPYYIAAQNIEHEYYERTGKYHPFAGICFADTLDIGRTQLGMFTPQNTERIQRQEAAPIRVILGNPPYNVGQRNENDNNKNRKYAEVDGRIRATYVKESRATLNAQLYDMYVRFFRWATDRLRGSDGIICFVSNNGFLDGVAFDGFRRSLLSEFTRIYHFDFKGNARTSGERRRREGGNIFGDQIRAGIGITLLIRNSNHADRQIYYHPVADYLKAKAKDELLAASGDYTQVTWQEITPDGRGTWLREGMAEEFEDFVPMGSREGKARTPHALFGIFGRGVCTNNDAYVYEFSADALSDRAERMVQNYGSEFDRWRRHGSPKAVESVLQVDEKVLKWIRNTKRTLARGQELDFDPAKLRTSLYRPFCKQVFYAERAFSEDLYRWPRIAPTVEVEQENRVICITDLGSEKPFMALVSSGLTDLHVVGAGSSAQCFPFYVYNEDGSNRRENITDWALAEYRARYGAEVAKWDIFHYVYGVLHSPEYRERYAQNLKRDLPRIPYVDAEAFGRFVKAGRALAELHVGYESAPEHPLRHIERTPFTWRVERMRLSADKTQLVVNDSLTLADIPPEVFEYRLGNRSALEWVVDQYRVKTDRRSGITSDPNDPEDPEKIVRLVGQVVSVSLETVRVVCALPPLGVEIPDAEA